MTAAVVNDASKAPRMLAPTVSVTIGQFLGATLPARPMAVGSATAFGDAPGARAAPTTVPWARTRFVLPTIVSSFALADALHMWAAVLFLEFGPWIVFDGALSWRSEAIPTTVAAALTPVSSATAQTLRRRRTEAWYAGRSPETG